MILRPVRHLTLNHVTKLGQKQVLDEKNRYTRLVKDYDDIKIDNARVSDKLIDQARSMRDNLLFFGFDECPTADQLKSENSRIL